MSVEYSQYWFSQLVASESNVPGFEAFCAHTNTIYSGMGRVIQRMAEVLPGRASCIKDVAKLSTEDISHAATDLLGELAIIWRSDVAHYAELRQLALVFMNNFCESCLQAYLDSKSCSAPSRASAEGSAKRPR